jgi:cobalt-zinc-cadmium efflux system protein
VRFGSVALLADAGHNAGDVLGLLLSWVAFALATKKTSSQFTYGFRNASTLAALANAVLIFVAVGGIAWEAVGRLGTTHVPDGRMVMFFSGIGIVINLGSALLFWARQKDDLNVRGAFLHLLGDALVSVGVLISGFLIQQTGRAWIDPVTSIVICAVILYGSWGLLRDSFALSMLGTPRGLDPQAVRESLLSVPGIKDVHDLHVWSVGVRQRVLTCHVLVVENGTESTSVIRSKIHDLLKERYSIQHATIQMEESACLEDCNGGEQSRTR